MMSQRNNDLSHENFDLRQELQAAYLELKQIGEERFDNLSKEGETEIDNGFDSEVMTPTT